MKDVGTVVAVIGRDEEVVVVAVLRESSTVISATRAGAEDGDGWVGIHETSSLSPVLRGEGRGEGRATLEHNSTIALRTPSRFFKTSSLVKRVTRNPC